MRSSVFWALVRKDLYMMRGLMIAMTAIGLGSFFVMGLGRIAFAVGGVLFLTANVAGGIFIAMLSLLTERKEQARMFALSLPISGQRYELSKLVSGYLTFGIPWFLLTLVAVWGFLRDAPGVDRGMVVYGLMIQGFVLALFSVVLTSLFAVTSEHVSGLMILVTNICFSLFMVQVNQPGVVGPLHTHEVVWTPFAQRMLAGELIAIVLCVAIALFAMSRRRDYV